MSYNYDPNHLHQYDYKGTKNVFVQVTLSDYPDEILYKMVKYATLVCNVPDCGKVVEKQSKDETDYQKK